MFNNCMKEYQGKKLYKYYSYDNSDCNMFAPVLNNTLRYRFVSSFNDPYDCYIASKNNGSIQSIRDSFMETVFVCSMTKDCDNFLMWSHYASSHRGYVVEYDVEKLKMIEEKQLESFREVEYSNSIVLHNLLNSSEAENKILQAIFHKPSCWSYEKEVRSAYYGSSQTDFKDIELPEGAITKIYLGSHFIAERKGKIPFFLKRWHKNGKLFYMQLLSDEYKVEPRKSLGDVWFDEKCSYGN